MQLSQGDEPKKMKKVSSKGIEGINLSNFTIKTVLNESMINEVLEQKGRANKTLLVKALIHDNLLNKNSKLDNFNELPTSIIARSLILEKDLIEKFTNAIYGNSSKHLNVSKLNNNKTIKGQHSKYDSYNIHNKQNQKRLHNDTLSRKFSEIDQILNNTIKNETIISNNLTNKIDFSKITSSMENTLKIEENLSKKINLEYNKLPNVSSSIISRSLSLEKEYNEKQLIISEREIVNNNTEVKATQNFTNVNNLFENKSETKLSNMKTLPRNKSKLLKGEIEELKKDKLISEKLEDYKNILIIGANSSKIIKEISNKFETKNVKKNKIKENNSSSLLKNYTVSFLRFPAILKINNESKSENYQNINNISKFEKNTTFHNLKNRYSDEDDTKNNTLVRKYHRLSRLKDTYTLNNTYTLKKNYFNKEESNSLKTIDKNSIHGHSVIKNTEVTNLTSIVVKTLKNEENQRKNKDLELNKLPRVSDYIINRSLTLEKEYNKKHFLKSTKDSSDDQLKHSKKILQISNKFPKKDNFDEIEESMAIQTSLKLEKDINSDSGFKVKESNKTKAKTNSVSNKEFSNFTVRYAIEKTLKLAEELYYKLSEPPEPPASVINQSLKLEKDFSEKLKTAKIDYHDNYNIQPNFYKKVDKKQHTQNNTRLNQTQKHNKPDTFQSNINTNLTKLESEMKDNKANLKTDKLNKNIFEDMKVEDMKSSVNLNADLETSAKRKFKNKTVNEYLGLGEKADSKQIKIKNVKLFENKNEQSSAEINNLTNNNSERSNYSTILNDKMHKVNDKMHKVNDLFNDNSNEDTNFLDARDIKSNEKVFIKSFQPVIEMNPLNIDSESLVNNVKYERVNKTDNKIMISEQGLINIKNKENEQKIPYSETFNDTDNKLVKRELIQTIKNKIQQDEISSINQKKLKCKL